VLIILWDDEVMFSARFNVHAVVIMKITYCLLGESSTFMIDWGTEENIMTCAGRH
jgi:hypothetical protein